MLIDTCSNGTGLNRFDRGRNYYIKNTDALIKLMDRSCDILCEVGSVVHHGQQNSFYLEALVQALLYHIDRFDQLLKTLNRQVGLPEPE
jgi:hypothetical protein